MIKKTIETVVMGLAAIVLAYAPVNAGSTGAQEKDSFNCYGDICVEINHLDLDQDGHVDVIEKIVSGPYSTKITKTDSKRIVEKEFKDKNKDGIIDRISLNINDTEGNPLLQRIDYNADGQPDLLNRWEYHCDGTRTRTTIHQDLKGEKMTISVYFYLDKDEKVNRVVTTEITNPKQVEAMKDIFTTGYSSLLRKQF